MLNGNDVLPAFGANNVQHEYGENIVGFYSGRHVWHWFMLMRDGTMIFAHSYSQNTGKTKKSYAQGQIAERLAVKLAAPICPDCSVKVHTRGSIETDWYGHLAYYRCHSCQTTFVSQNGGELAIAANLR